MGNEIEGCTPVKAGSMKSPPTKVFIALRGALAEERTQGWFLRRRAADRLRWGKKRQEIRIVMEEGRTILPDTVQQALECQGVSADEITLVGSATLDTLFEFPDRTFLILGSSRAGVIETLEPASRWRVFLAPEGRIDGLERAWDRMNEAAAIENDLRRLGIQGLLGAYEKLLERSISAARADGLRARLEDYMVRAGIGQAETSDTMDNLDILIGRTNEYAHACRRALALLTGEARIRVRGRCPHPILIGGTAAWENLCLTCELRRLLDRDGSRRRKDADLKAA